MLTFFAERWPLLLLGLAISTAVAFLFVFVVVPMFIVQLPERYFVDDDRPSRGWLAFVVRNMLGGSLFLVGPIVMTPLFWFPPGTGFLLMATGIMLMEFPGRRKLLRQIVGIPSVANLLNSIRARAGESPFLLDPPDRSQGS